MNRELNEGHYQKRGNYFYTIENLDNNQVATLVSELRLNKVSLSDHNDVISAFVAQVTSLRNRIS